MSDTLSNAGRIGKEFIYDLGSKYVSPAVRALIYSSGLNDTSSLSGDLAKAAVNSNMRGINAAKDWINSSVPRKAGQSPAGGSHVVIAETPGQVNDTVAGSGLPADSGNPALSGLVGPTRYENSSGAEIAPQSGNDFMSRRGAFTGPNNDPTTPGMTRQYVKAPALTSFYPDDARYAKRQDEIKAQEAASQIAMREEAAARAEEENRRRITNEAEDRRIAAEERARRIEMEDRAEAFRADQQRTQLELLKAAEEYKAKWSAEHGGTPYSPQAAAQALKHEQKVGVANDHDAAVSAINTDETSINQDLDMIEAGGVPADPQTVSVVEAITGAPFGKVPLDKTQIQQIKIKVAQRAAEARANAALRFQSLMEQMRVTERRQPQEDLEP